MKRPCERTPSGADPTKANRCQSLSNDLGMCRPFLVTTALGVKQAAVMFVSNSNQYS
jgi:hypothetical protein